MADFVGMLIGATFLVWLVSLGIKTIVIKMFVNDKVALTVACVLAAIFCSVAYKLTTGTMTGSYYAGAVAVWVYKFFNFKFMNTPIFSRKKPEAE